MLEINRWTTDAVFYLYRSAEEAQEGRNPRGTGFFSTSGAGLFAVTAWHVACQDGASCIGHQVDDRRVVVELDPSDWVARPAVADVAVAELNRGQFGDNLKTIGLSQSMRREWFDFRLGDPVFMLGLFVDYKGHERHSPMARFGRLAMVALDEAKIDHDGRQYSSHVVDMHSRGGFSGSPVFAYRDFERAMDFEKGQVVIPSESAPRFIGIHYAQFREQWQTDERQSLRGPSGMVCVAPAWEIVDLLRFATGDTADPDC